MTAELETLRVTSRPQWRAWLTKHHTSSRGVWFVFYKAHTGVKSIPYEEVVREALCFGWIDSLVKRLDDDRYAVKVTPRKPTSKWSDLNRRRWAELKSAGLLTPAGLAAAPTTNAYGAKPVIPHCRERLKGRTAIEEALTKEHAGWARRTSLRATDVTVRALDAERAVVMFKWEITSDAERGAKPFRGNMVLVVTKARERWVIIAGQAAAVQVPK